MELQRILARDARSATDQALSRFGPDVFVISNQRVAGQTELMWMSRPATRRMTIR
jgi:flagellar biosynthesis GTPase FlhF